MVCFNDVNLYNKAKILRAWGRSSAIFNEKFKNRFGKDKFKFNYDKKYVFREFGYNFIPSEISAAFGVEQLKNLKNNFSIRVKNFIRLKKLLKDYNNFIELLFKKNR